MPNPPAPSAKLLLEDRTEAGRRLAIDLARRWLPDPIVLALPRGGVPVAVPIAQRLGAPLDVLVCRKVGAPGDPEYGLGAVAEDGTVFLDAPRIAAAGFSMADLEPAIARERRRARNLAARLRGPRPFPELVDRSVVLVDDGIATGGTALAAGAAVRKRSPARILVAAGVIPPGIERALRPAVDEVVAVLRPAQFSAVGEFYSRFEPVDDLRVVELLARTSGAATTGTG